MFKILILHQMQSLSDEQTAFQVRDRYAFGLSIPFVGRCLPLERFDQFPA